MKPTNEAIEAAIRYLEAPMSAREQMEQILTAAFAAQFQIEEYAGVIRELRLRPHRRGYETEDEAKERRQKEREEAADALEALLAERDALKAELIDYKDAAASEADFVNEQAEKIRELKSERDALAARLAPVEDEALVEIVGRTLRAEVFDPDVLKVYGDLWAYDEQRKILKQARAAIAAIRPHIEAAERERCAKIATGQYWSSALGSDGTAKAIAAAIRSGK